MAISKSEKGIFFHHLKNNLGFENDFNIILSHVDKIPPHISLSFQANLFSLAYNGKKENYPLEKWLIYVKRKNIPCIFIKITMAENPEMIKNIIQKSYNNYQQLIAGKISCLSPIKDIFCGIKKEEKYLSFNSIFDFLPYLNEMKLIEETFQLNFNEVTNTHCIETYTQQQIQDRIKSLQSI
jgi:hypothetical protein